jgi:hypothetical protein
MNPSYLLIALLALSGCDGPSSFASGNTPSPTKLPDGTLAIDSGQGGSFEITILPLDLDASWEPNEQATKESTIELEIDGKIRVAIPKNDVLRITGLSKRRLSVVEFVDGKRASSFFVDGTTKPRMVADYYEIYGNWIVREPIGTGIAEQAGTGQPATRPEAKSEGGDKPQPESEGRSR